METEAFLKSGIKPDYASQSGPMLVIDGAIHPKFSEDGQSRSGATAWARPMATRWSSSSASPGSIFTPSPGCSEIDLGCHNALFLDGSISSLYAPELGRSDGFFPLGPIVALVKWR